MKNILTPGIAAALLASACAGQPEVPLREQPETPVQEQAETPIQKQPDRPGVCDRYPTRDSFYGAPILFDFDSASLGPDAIDYIARLADYLKCFPDSKHTISGHTDARGPRYYNIDLGCRRAGAVRGEMIERSVEAKRMSIISYGADRPAVIGDNEDAWMSNRRVELNEWVESRETNCGER